MNKGMSQVLGLIIAGVVFMMLALTLTTLTGNIGDFLGNTQQSTCLSNIQTNCENGVERIPASCVNDGEVIVSRYGLTEGESSDVGSNLSELQEGASDDLKCETLRANYGFADTASKKQEIASKIQELEGCNIPNENSNQQGSAP